MTQKEEILIIGGGVIGVCAAYYLAQTGRSVTLVEKNEICAGSSYGNAGWIANGHVLPLTVPGRLTQGLKWLLDASSPFYIQPRLDWELLRWLWQFQSACNETQMYQAVPVLLGLNQISLDLFKQLAVDENLAFGYERKGLLHLFKSQHKFEEGVEEAVQLRKFGVEAALLDSAGVHHLEPNVSPTVKNGIYYPDYAHLMPDRFVRELARLVEERGVQIKTGTEVLGFGISGGRISTVKTTRGTFSPDQVVLAAGAWSSGLARSLRLNLPIQPAKGYSFTFKRPATCPRLPLSLPEHKVAITPTGEWLRFAGTLELAGLDPAVNQRRLAAIRLAASQYLPDVAELDLIEIWRGFRPLTADDLPIIGRSPGFENLILATGHGMLGITHGPVTGKLVTQIIAGEAPAVDLRPLRAERFL